MGKSIADIFSQDIRHHGKSATAHGIQIRQAVINRRDALHRARAVHRLIGCKDTGSDGGGHLVMADGYDQRIRREAGPF